MEERRKRRERRVKNKNGANKKIVKPLRIHNTLPANQLLPTEMHHSKYPIYKGI
jgi:hypothetical protein